MFVMKEEDKRDYDELTDKHVGFFTKDYNNGEILKGRVVGCSYDIGVTIVDWDDPDRYFYCANGRMSKVGKQVISECGEHKYDDYDEEFMMTVRMLRAGYFNADVPSGVGDDVGADVCPFHY